MKKMLAGLMSMTLSVFPNMTSAHAQSGENGRYMMDGIMGGGIPLWILLGAFIGGSICWQMNRSNQQLCGQTLCKGKNHERRI